MVQILPENPSIFGAIGRGVGQGLSDQLPKEVERYRLSQGLQQFAQQNPDNQLMQQYAQLLSIPGITPQGIETFGQLAKQQNLRNAYPATGKKGKQNLAQEGVVQKKEPLTQAIRDVPFANRKPTQQRTDQGIDQNSRPQQPGQPQIVAENPTRPEAIPQPRWTQERMEEEIGNELSRDPEGGLPAAINRATNNETRDLARSQTERDRDEYYKGIQKEVKSKFDDQLKKKLEKSDQEGVFKDVTGEHLANIERNMEREIKSSPRTSADDIIDKWSTKALNFAKTKSQLNKFLDSRDFVSDLISKDENLRKLSSYQKTFEETGNLDEFYNLLKADGLSPSGAATVSRPIDKSTTHYISKIKPSSEKGKGIALNNIENSRKYAIDLEKNISNGQSVLAIMRALKKQDMWFDESEFLKQLDEDRDRLGLAPWQENELSEGASAILPTWGDLKTLKY